MSLETSSLSFPANPVINQTVDYQGKTYSWTGLAWRQIIPPVANYSKHPGSAKCWAFVTVAGGVPTLVASYNITSITDTGVGQLTVTIATDFSSANWAAAMALTNPTATPRSMCIVSQLAGSILLENDGKASDPTAWHFVGYGEQ